MSSPKALEIAMGGGSEMYGNFDLACECGQKWSGDFDGAFVVAAAHSRETSHAFKGTVEVKLPKPAEKIVWFGPPEKDNAATH